MISGRVLSPNVRRKREALLATAREVFDAGDFFDLRFDDCARLTVSGHRRAVNQQRRRSTRRQ